MLTSSAYALRSWKYLKWAYNIRDTFKVQYSHHSQKAYFSVIVKVAEEKEVLIAQDQKEGRVLSS
jgi:hypothetical protein